MLQDTKITHSVCKADCALKARQVSHGGNIFRWLPWKYSPFSSSVKYFCHCIFGKRWCERGGNQTLMYHYINCLRDLNWSEEDVSVWTKAQWHMQEEGEEHYCKKVGTTEQCFYYKTPAVENNKPYIVSK